MNPRPKILLCWGYNRPGWVKYFEQLNDFFEFTYLFYLYPEEETVSYTANKKIYYTSYTSPFTLLKENSISKIIFMGMDGWQTIALNVAAKKLKIPTFYMMHGAVTLGFQGLRAVVYKRRNIFKETFTRKLYSWIFTLRFLLNALGWKDLRYLPALIKLQIQKTNMHPAIAMMKNKIMLRNPDKYIVFSKLDIDFYIEQDGCSKSDFIVLGSLEITSFIDYANKEGIKKEPYLLYIETPLSIINNNQFNVNLLTKEEYNQLIQSMSDYALMNGLKLYVKLHPYSYNNDYYIVNSNTVYFADEPAEPLILNSTGIIAYNSSLTIPALYFKNCCLLKINELDDFQRRIADLNICSITDYKEFIGNYKNISFLKTDGETKSRKQYVEKFIEPNMDGLGLQRLRQHFEK